jgi:transcriptional regulator with XRE-family HTH domain
VPARLEDVIARNVARLRAARGWTQADLALRMRGLGFTNWQANRAAQIETLRRPVTLAEVLMLSWLFGEPLSALFDGDGLADLGHGATADLAAIRAIITGDVTAELPEADPGADTGELRRIARNLGLSPDVLNWLAHSIYGRDFFAERDHRAGDTSGMGKRSVQTKRGNITRTMTAELAGVIRAQGMDRVQRGYQAATGG